MTADVNHQRIVELTLLLLAAFITCATVALAAVGEEVEITWSVVPYLAALLILWTIAHITLRLRAPTANGVLFPIAALLQGLGFALMVRIDPSLASRQATWSLIGMAGFIAVTIGIRNPHQLSKVRAPLGIAGVLLVFLPLISQGPPSGSEISLALHLGQLHIVPGELGKLFLIIFFASWLANYRTRNTEEYLGQAQHVEGDRSRLIPLLGGWLITSAILIFQYDAGSAIITFVVFMSMWWVAAGRPLDLAVSFGAIAATIVLAAGTLPEFQTRLSAWIDPWSNAQLGDAITRSSFALAGGGLTGTGPGAGNTDWVPGVTDHFAFVPIGEELGFIGATAVLSAYLLLTGVGLRIATRARREFDSVLAIGVTVFLGVQAWASIATTLRLLPPSAVSLPFISINGFALLTWNLALGLLLRISEIGPEAADQTAVLPKIKLKSRSQS